MPFGLTRSSLMAQPRYSGSSSDVLEHSAKHETVPVILITQYDALPRVWLRWMFSVFLSISFAIHFLFPCLCHFVNCACVFSFCSLFRCWFLHSFSCIFFLSAVYFLCPLYILMYYLNPLSLPTGQRNRSPTKGTDDGCGWSG